jgi:uncharacterized protein DUF4105
VRTALCACMLFSVFSSRLSAQNIPRTVQANPQVFLITIGEGEYYWEKFGHNAIWFYDPDRGIDVAFNWGVFDFTSPGFLRRLLIGNALYAVEGVPGPAFIEAYRSYDRTVVLQRLNLTPEQARKAYEFSLWNAREENKYYRYDYFRDNCSTRVRDVIDLALGGALKARTANMRLGGTYRLETVRLVDDMKLTQFGIDVALGQPADRRLTLWEDMFVPSTVRDAARSMTVPISGGRAAPLVAEERVYYESRAHRERRDFPKLWIPYLVVGLLLGAELFAVGWAGQRSRVADKIFRIEVAAWALLTGLLGLVLLLAWMITQHVFWYHNENLLLLNPLSLSLAVLAALSAWRTRWTRRAAIVAVIVAMLSALALIVKALPVFPQDNIPVILLLLPPHFAVAYGLWRRASATAIATR